jgi:CHAT domain-containing protein
LSTNPEWAKKFQILEAEVVLVRGDYPQVLSLLDGEPDARLGRDQTIKVLALQGVANARLHHFREAEKNLANAEALCRASEEVTCGDVFRARGVLLLQQGDPSSAKYLFEQTAAFARLHGDSFLDATASLNLGLGALREQHFDEALDWTDAAYRAASSLGAGAIAEKALGNLGWAYYYLGDSDKSLERSLEAEKLAAQVGADTDRLTWITGAGYVYASQGNLAGATEAYREALALATKTGGKEAIYDTYRALALVAVEDRKLEDARNYSDKATEIARSDKNRLQELYPMLIDGVIAAHLHDTRAAERMFHEVERDPETNASLKWRSEHALAHLYEDEGRSADADREYRTALSTFEAARSSLQRNDSKLPFSNNASRIYDDYIHFLVKRRQTDDALRWADYSRARTLAEGLGLLPSGTSAAPSHLNPREIAQRTGGTILFYWLGEKQSYLWAITPQKTMLLTLPPGAEINSSVERYRKALVGPQDVLQSADHDGQSLYRTLVAPAQAFLQKGGKVVVIPDGRLNNLNFETLLVSEPAPHYWIEDATVASASSLRVLNAARMTTGAVGNKTGDKKDGRARRLLLIGDSISPNDKYPELPKASAQMESVARHFPGTEELILKREQATPRAYLESSPERYPYIHFVAHGTASRLSPLDSAIVLSKISSKSEPSQSAPPSMAVLSESSADESFKLYARDIIGHPLHADLVTVSSCYGAGERAYAGEGLVGLSWAFLRAGAHNVVAALWEASDASTAQLMDKFYDELNKGASPDAALRTAKLSLLHDSGFRNPFYWAPFQLYTGS